MFYTKKNGILTILLFFFTALSWSQLFDKASLKIKATDLYYQGVFPNVDPALALYDDFNIKKAELEEANFEASLTSFGA